MIMARNEDGTYSQVGFVKDNAGIDTEYIYDKDGDIVFEKGFTRETSGTVPLTINGIGKDLKDWSITGNTVQNGTPTPENPVEVKAVGDRTGNRFNLQYWSNTTTDTRSYFQLSITLYNGSTSLGECRFNVHETGKVALTSATAGADGATRLAIKHNGSTRDLAIGSAYDDFPANQPLTISFDVSGYDPTIAGGISISNIMLNSGSSALPFEPYGYKIPFITSAEDGTESITTPIYLPTPLYSGEVIRSDGTITRSDGTTETFTAPQIPTLSGTTVIDVDTAVKPTEMYAKYKSSK